jgi:uncharacterized protein
MGLRDAHIRQPTFRAALTLQLGDNKGVVLLTLNSVSNISSTHRFRSGGIVPDHNRPDHRLLRLQVGFLLKEGAGYSREVDFDIPGSFTVEDTNLLNLKGTLRLTRTPQGVLLQGVLAASIATECVRCLSPAELPFEVTFSDLFLNPNTTDPISEPSEPYYVIEESGFIDLTPLVREEAILAIPIRPLCSPDCKGLCPECGTNLNTGTCDCAQEHFDPRLASLRALLED